ncbi:MAG: hypothetical protein WD018_01465 [Nitrosopumilaceae archaeon]
MKKKTAPIVVGILVVAAIVSAIYFYEKEKSSDEIKSQWISSGPFAIDKPRYKIGENIFLSVHGLKPNEAGNIIISGPKGIIWTELPFNGTLKSDFNYYFKPETSRMLKIFNPEDLVGTWKVVFQGLTYEPLSFEIVNEFLPGAESDIKPIPRPNETKTIGPMQ